MDGVNDRTGYLQHFRHVTKEAGSGTFACHFLHRTTEVDVNEIGLGLLHDERRVSHGLGFTSVYLDRNRPLGVMDGEFAGRGGYVADERIGVDELRIDTVGSVALAERTEGRIGNVLHGSEI